MKTEQQIKQDLAAQTRELDALIQNSNTLSGYLKAGFSNANNGLMKMGYVLAALLSVLLIFCAYRFFTAAAADQVFWGVCLIVSLQAQIATKLWVYQQTNRIQLSKEIRLLASIHQQAS
ncbi:MAG: hypothetical protein HWE26_16075 [Alteromonadaceae bacterium]|nr:hypothetical protein [Alteromonadaceae bacterium]